MNEIEKIDKIKIILESRLDYLEDQQLEFYNALRMEIKAIWKDLLELEKHVIFTLNK